MQKSFPTLEDGEGDFINTCTYSTGLQYPKTTVYVGIADQRLVAELGHNP